MMNIVEQEKKEIEAPMVISGGHEVDSTVVANKEEVLDAVEVDNETLPDEKQDDEKKVHMKVEADAPWSERMWEVFTTFWYLGLVAFGGPQVRSHEWSMDLNQKTMLVLVVGHWIGG